MITRTALVMIMAAVLAAPVWADPVVGADTHGGAKGDPQQPRPGPRAGEMIILGPESRYVTRAARGADGKVRVGCERDDVSGPKAISAPPNAEP